MATNLRKWSTTVLRDKAVADKTQLTVSTATVDVYLRGASVHESEPVAIPAPGSATIQVYDVGRLEIGDTVKVGTSPTQNLTVTDILDSENIEVSNASSEQVVLSHLSRLVITSRRPTLYRESTGVFVLSEDGQTTSSAQGLVEFYTAEQSFDYIISGSGFTTTLYINEEGGMRTPGWVNVQSYPTFQAAVDAVDEFFGGTVFIPAGLYSSATVPALGPIVVTGKDVSFVGEGANGTHLFFSDTDNDSFVITGRNNWTISGLRCTGSGVAGAARGLVIDSCGYFEVKNCWFDNYSSWSIDFADSAGDCVLSLFDNVRSTRNQSGGGLRLGSSTTRAFSPKFRNCIFTVEAAIPPVDVSWAWKPAFRDCAFESTVDTNLVYSNGYTIGLTLEDGWFETSAATANNWMIVAQAGTNPSWKIEDCHFIRTNGSITEAKIFKSFGGTTNLKFGNFFCQLGGIPAGTDDLVFSSGDIAIIEGGRVVKIGNTNPKEPTITAADWATITRTFSNLRMKSIAMTTASRDALTDQKFGDMLFNSDLASQGGEMQVFNGTVWKNMTVSVKTSAVGAPTQGKWSVGDMVWNTSDNKIYVCSTAGTGGVDAVFKSTVALT